MRGFDDPGVPKFDLADVCLGIKFQRHKLHKKRSIASETIAAVGSQERCHRGGTVFTGRLPAEQEHNCSGARLTDRKNAQARKARHRCRGGF